MTSVPSLVHSVMLAPRRVLLVVGVIGAVATLATAQLVAVAAVADDQPVAAADQESAPGALVPFDVSGLPAGAARGVPSHTTLPPNFTLKHVHGGPSYVYVIKGSLDIIDGDGTTVTYHEGNFFWEPAGHIHTVKTTTDRAELFIIQFLPPGAVGTIPAQ